MSWLTPPTKIFLVFASLLLALGVAGLGSIFFPSRRWEETARTLSRELAEQKVMKPNPLLR